MMEKTIKFKNLSGWLKFATIGGFIYMCIAVLAFIIGFIYGLI